MRVKNVYIGSGNLSADGVRDDIVLAKKEGNDQLTYTYEPEAGPYLTIELKDFNEFGYEVEEK